MKKGAKFFYLTVTVGALIMMVVSGFILKSGIDEFGLRNLDINLNEIEEREELYILPADATAYQKEIYDQLTVATQKFPEQYDEFEVASLVVKSFVADFFTWTNKDGSYDVGGLDYIYGPHHLDVHFLARDTFYDNFNLFAKEFGVGNLIEVESIETKVDYAAPLYTENWSALDTYYVEAVWEYKEGTLMDVSKIQNSAYYNVVYNKDNGRFEIALSYPLD